MTTQLFATGEAVAAPGALALGELNLSQYLDRHTWEDLCQAEP